MKLTKADADKVLDILAQLRATYVKRDALVLQVMRHPDATANQIMALHEGMVESTARYRELHEAIGARMHQQNGHYEWNGRLDKWERLRY